MQLREQVKHASAEARTDIQKAIGELEQKKDLAEKNAGHSLRNHLFLGTGKGENGSCDGRSSRLYHEATVLFPLTVDP